MKHRYIATLACAAALAVLTSCQKPNNNARVKIEFEQIANFAVYYLSSDSSSSHGAGDGMFVMYSIKKITNTGSEAKTFVFNKHKVVAVTPDETSNEEPNSDNILLGSELANNITVAPGATVTNLGCIIKHVLTPNPQSLANTSGLVELIHQIDQSQPVTMTRIAGNTSVALVSNALPSSLQGLCN